MGRQVARRFTGVFLAGAILATVFILRYFFPVVAVHGLSMSPTYKDGELLICTRVHVASDIHTGDVVVASGMPGLDRTVIKRVAACPLESVEIEGTVYQMRENEYLLIGDNLAHSYDGRNYGAVGLEHIILKVNDWRAL